MHYEPRATGITVATEPVSYLIFDVETIGDGDLISRVRYPNENLSADAALARYRAELLEQTGKDVLPVTYVLPIAVAVAKVDADFRLIEVVTIDSPAYRPHVIAQDFWRGWKSYRCPTLVTFNGRGYDLPVMELAAFRYGLSVKEWFNVDARSFEQRRNRYNHAAHLDLHDFLNNFGATRLVGGLNLIANLIGKPGKTGIDGSQVQDLFAQGEVAAINDYCMGDVLDTYFVFLRTRVLAGFLSLEVEQQRVEQARDWIAAQTDSRACQHYLAHWGSWSPPANGDASPSP